MTEWLAAQPPEYVDLQERANLVFRGTPYRRSTQLRARDLVRALQDYWHIGFSILDAGCRDGVALHEFRTLFPPSTRVEGIDIVPDFVAEAEQYAPARVADLCALPYADCEFDWIFCSHALEHCWNPPQAAAELRRVAKLGISLFVPLESAEPTEAHPDHPGHFYSTLDPMDWLRLMHGDGWTIVHLALDRDRGDMATTWNRLAHMYR